MPRYPVPERGPHLDFDRLIAKRIADRRRVLGMSQETLGNYLGVSRDLITRIETNRASLNAGDIPALALALRVPISHFYALRTVDDADLVRNESISGNVRESISQLGMRLGNKPLASATLTDEEQKALDALQKIGEAISHYQAAFARQGDPEISELLSSLDSDLAGALTEIARTLYELQLNRSFPAAQAAEGEKQSQRAAAESETFFEAYEDEELVSRKAARDKAGEWLSASAQGHQKEK